MRSQYKGGASEASGASELRYKIQKLKSDPNTEANIRHQHHTNIRYNDRSTIRYNMYIGERAKRASERAQIQNTEATSDTKYRSNIRYNDRSTIRYNDRSTIRCNDRGQEGGDFASSGWFRIEELTLAQRLTK